MPNRTDAVEQWGMQDREASKASARRYEKLFASNLRVPEVHMNRATWDRIVHGLPRDYTMPDETLLRWVADWVQERRRAEYETKLGEMTVLGEEMAQDEVMASNEAVEAVVLEQTE
ncbi:MAG: hypothetical protein ACXVOI_06985 [Tumebacillaceae bacterium]